MARNIVVLAAVLIGTLVGCGTRTGELPATAPRGGILESISRSQRTIIRISRGPRVKPGAEHNEMASTTWLGITTDASLDSNWSNGVPDGLLPSTVDVFVNDTTELSMINFGSSRAFGTLTTTGNFGNTETVTIDTKVYTFQTVLTDVDGNVLIGTDAEDSIDNLVLAITLGSGAGTKYAASMTAHTTCTGTKPTASTFRAVALNAGTGGNSFDSTETAANASWGAATLQSGSANGAAIVNDVDIRDWRGDINSSGSEAGITFNKFYHGGWGTVYIDAQAGNRFIIDSPNYALAAHLIMTGDVAIGLEFVQGRSSVDWAGLTGSTTVVWVDDSQVVGENLSITGTGTIPQMICSRGIVTTNGPTITEYTVNGGDVSHESGAITTLRTSGYFRLTSTDTITKAYITGNTLTLLENSAVKTLTTVYLSPSGTFLRRDDIDSFTLHEIGIQ
jgi:hypothetical protein